MLVASEWTPELALHISSRMDAPGGAQTELRSSPKKVVLISTGCRKPSVSALAWTPPGGAQTTRGIPPFVALHRRISVGAICALAALLFRDYLEMLVAPERTLELRRSPKKSTGQGVLKSWQLALHISSGLDPLPPPGSAHTTRGNPFFMALHRGMSADTMAKTAGRTPFTLQRLSLPRLFHSVLTAGSFSEASWP